MILFAYDFEFLIPAILVNEGGPLPASVLLDRCQMYVHKWSGMRFSQMSPHYRERLGDLFMEGLVEFTDDMEIAYTGP